MAYRYSRPNYLFLNFIGQPRTISPTAIPVNAYRSNSGDIRSTPPVIDARKLLLTLQEKSASHFSFLVRAESYCRVAEELRILSTCFRLVTTCFDFFLGDLACEASRSDADEPCYTQSQEFYITKLGVACDGDSSPIDAYPIKITLAANSLPRGSSLTVNEISDSG